MTVAVTALALAWSHALAAVLFMGVAVWQAKQWRDRAARTVIIACALTGVWAAVTASAGVETPSSQFTESIRNLAWLSFLYALLRRAGAEYRSLRALYSVLAFVSGVTAAIALIALVAPTGEAPTEALLLSAFALRLVFAMGALVAVHNLYVATAAGARAGVGLPLAALGALWGLDLTVYALCWVQGSWVGEFAVARGAVAAALHRLVDPAFADRRVPQHRVRHGARLSGCGHRVGICAGIARRQLGARDPAAGAACRRAGRRHRHAVARYPFLGAGHADQASVCAPL